MASKAITQKLALGVASTAASLCLAVPASAGTYEITACEAAPANVNHAFELVESDPNDQIETRVQCPHTVGETYQSPKLSGLAIFDRLQTTDATQGDSTEWRLRAPTGTNITRLRYNRYLGVNGTDAWTLYGRMDGGQVFESDCSTLVNDPCVRSGTADVQGITTPAVHLGMQCDGGADFCTTGFSVHAAWFAIYSATATITDNTNPSFSSASTPLRAPGLKRGSVASSATGSDSTGIKEARLYVDGTQRAQAQNSDCDSTYPAPCVDHSTQGTSATLPLNLATGALADGSHTARFSVIDAAGNESFGSDIPFTSDNNAPGSPEGLAVAGGPTGVSASWSNPAGQVSPIARAHYQLCTNGSCSSGSQAGTNISSLDGFVPGNGNHTLTVWLEDEAGNVNPAAARTVSFSFGTTGGGGSTGGSGGGGGSVPATKAPAGLEITDVDFNDAETKVTLRGNLSSKASGRLRLVYTPKTKSSNGASGKATVREIGVAKKWKATLELTKDGRTMPYGKVIAFYPGDADTKAETEPETVKR